MTTVLSPSSLANSTKTREELFLISDHKSSTSLPTHCGQNNKDKPKKLMHQPLNISRLKGKTALWTRRWLVLVDKKQNRYWCSSQWTFLMTVWLLIYKTHHPDYGLPLRTPPIHLMVTSFFQKHWCNARGWWTLLDFTSLYRWRTLQFEFGSLLCQVRKDIKCISSKWA